MDCVFCKIAKGEIPCFKIWENQEFIAFLDIKPATEGMTLVIPKDHYDSNLFKNDSELIDKLMRASKEVAKILNNFFNSERVALMFEGIDIKHLHAKLYPLKNGESVEAILSSNHEKPSIGHIDKLAHDIFELSKRV